MAFALDSPHTPERRSPEGAAGTASPGNASNPRTTEPFEGPALWRGLSSGQWSVVDRQDHDGRSFYVACRNEPAIRRQRALTSREREIVACACEGLSNKLIASALGLATSTIAVYLAAAQRKLGLSTRTELIQLISVLLRSGLSRK
jgi:DNA-binding CsgD family transcriptional regulator